MKPAFHFAACWFLAWQNISENVIIHLSLTNGGYTAIMVLIARTNEHFALAWTDMLAVDMAYIIANSIFCLHGLPIDIVLNRDPRFAFLISREKFSPFLVSSLACPFWNVMLALARLTGVLSIVCCEQCLEY